MGGCLRGGDGERRKDTNGGPVITRSRRNCWDGTTIYESAAVEAPPQMGAGPILWSGQRVPCSDNLCASGSAYVRSPGRTGQPMQSSRSRASVCTGQQKEGTPVETYITAAPSSEAAQPTGKSGMQLSFVESGSVRVL